MWREPCPAPNLPSHRLSEADLAAALTATEGDRLTCDQRRARLVGLIDAHNAAQQRLAAPKEGRGWWPW